MHDRTVACRLCTMMSDLAVTLGHRIRVARTEAKLSQGELARAAGVTRTTISRVETGRSLPDVRTLKALSESLDVSVDRLLGRE